MVEDKSSITFSGFLQKSFHGPCRSLCRSSVKDNFPPSSSPLRKEDARDATTTATRVFSFPKSKRTVSGHPNREPCHDYRLPETITRPA